MAAIPESLKKEDADAPPDSICTHPTGPRIVSVGVLCMILCLVSGKTTGGLNRGLQRDLGVRFEKGHWVAYLGRKRLGRCQDEITAARAYDKVARERYREFAYLNFPDEESQGQP